MFRWVTPKKQYWKHEPFTKYLLKTMSHEIENLVYVSVPNTSMIVENKKQPWLNKQTNKYKVITQTLSSVFFLITSSINFSFYLILNGLVVILNVSGERMNVTAIGTSTPLCLFAVFCTQPDLYCDHTKIKKGHTAQVSIYTNIYVYKHIYSIIINKYIWSINNCGLQSRCKNQNPLRAAFSSLTKKNKVCWYRTYPRSVFPIHEHSHIYVKFSFVLM